MALRKVGVIFSAEGYAQYLGELKSVNQEMRTLSTESKLAVAQLGNNASTNDTYATKMKSMTSQIDLARNRTKMLTDQQKILGEEQKRLPGMIEDTTKRQKESANQTRQLKKAYDDLVKTKGADAEETKEASKAYKESAKETKALKAEMKDLELTYSRNAKTLEKLPNDIAKSNLEMQRQINLQQKLHTEYRNSGGRYTDLANNFNKVGTAITGAGDRMQEFGGYMTTRFTMPIVTGFGMAVKEATAFQTELGSMLPLIAGSGNITAEHRKEVEELGIATREMAIDYGKSTTEINNGMAELIRNGYTSAQVLGMVPNVLDASIASGEQFGTVMGTTANVLSQFQLRGKDTNETLTNTQRVVDSLTYVANATSSGFYDLGQGMAYVGPVANTLNMSVEETASILGILSDNGIEASQGGTALRGALTRLLKPSKQNYEAMQELGISVEGYKAGLIDFPTILDTIAENTKDLTAEQKAALIATAFGTESQSAMNALVNAGGDALRDMTGAAEDAAGATKEIAEAIKETPEFEFQQSLAQLRDVGIEIGSKLLPHVTTGVSAIGDWVESFNNLSDSTQNFIIKAGLVVAAVGPVVTILGKVVSGTGKVVSGVGDMIRAFGKITTPKTLETVGDALDDIPGKASVAGASASLFSNPYVVASGVAIAAIAAVGAYLLYEANEPARAHAESVRETDGAYQDWFDGVSAGIGTITELGETAIASAQETTQAYKDALNDIQNANAETQNALSTMFGENVFGGNEYRFFEGEWLNQFRLRLDNVTRSMREFGASEEEITRVQTAFNNYGTMLTNTQSEVFRLFEAEQKVTADWAYAQTEAIDGVTKAVVAGLEERRTARQAELDAQLEGQYITQQVYDQEIQALNQYTDQAIASIQKSTQSIKEMFATASRENRALHESEVTSFVQSMLNISKVTGESLSENQEIMNLLADNMSFLTQHTSVEAMKRMGILDDEAINALKNAETTEQALQIMIDALDAYGAKELEPKNAYVDGEQAEAELMSLTDLVNEWNNLTLDEKRAQVETRGKEEIDELLESLGVDWEALTPTQKEYYAQAEGGEALENILYLTGEFERGTDAITKYAILETQIDSEAILGAIQMRDLWNNADFMSLAMEVDTNAPDAEAQIVNLINYFSAQQGLPPLQMETEALTEESQQKLAELISAYTGADTGEVLEFLTSTNAGETTEEIKEFDEVRGGVAPETTATFTAGVAGVDEATGVIQEHGDAIDSVPESKSSEVTSNIFSMIANTVAVLAYNVATGLMEDKSVSAETSTPNMFANTLLVLGYNSAVDNMTNKTSTLTTSAPGIVVNTALAWGWISALNSAYNRTSTLTTVHRTVNERVGFATGGHIDAYADGGNIQWAGGFATGGNVPKGYSGIVGEAGPEIFTVTNRGVSITPLNSREKMRGVGGAIEDEVARQLGETNGINLTINIDQPVISDRNDLNELKNMIVQAVDETLGQKGRYKQRGLAM